MAAPNASRPGRALTALVVVIAALFALIWFSVAVATPKGSWTPKLGLDLEGGTSVTLIPRVQTGQSGALTQDSINRAVEIIRQRVDGFGVAESEVAAQGTGNGRNIVITIPGKQGGGVLDLVRQTAELRFRPVLVETAGGIAPPASSPTPSPAATPRPSASPRATGVPSPTGTANGRAIPRALTAAAAPSTTPRPSAPAAPSPPATPAANGGVTPQLQAQLAALDCSKTESRRGGGRDDAKQPLVTCSRDGAAKYILGPAEVLGTDVSSARAGLEQNSQGVSTGGWEVQLEFTGEGTKKFATTTTRLAALQPPLNQFAIVLDGLVVSAPRTVAITGGQASITGNFTQKEATDLANVLKYGALPLAFDPGELQEISPTLGGDQLRAGLIAGALGLGLVVLYSLLYYRALGFVTVASLVVAALLTYAAVVLLGWRIGFRLSLAGVAGLIVAIGITADSFIVFFERLRDEVRDGKSLRVAVETGWVRARRTILSADAVSFIAAVVLYVLSTGGVKGFAFTLGLTTVIDVVVVFLFTKPLVTLLARTAFFGGGHRLSGLDPGHLGARRALTRPVAGAPARRRPGTATTTAVMPATGPKEA